MDNNRLYLLDTKTNEKILLCKSFGQWKMYHDAGVLDHWLHNRDCEAAISSSKPSKLKLVTENEKF